MNIFKKAIKEAKDFDAVFTEYKTPKFRKPTPPPKPNPNYTPPHSVKKPCHYITPCGWCTKWDKKCDKKIPKPEPCGQCHYNNWFLPQCDESNDFKNFRVKVISK